MNRLEILQQINDFSINNDVNKIIKLLNLLLSDEKLINEFEDLIMMIIDSAQLYGYTKYIEKDIKSYFLNNEVVSYRSSSYNSTLFQYLNCGQLSILNEIEKNKKVFISAPTSFGKTSLINEYILKNKNLYNQVLYIVPTNSLTEEIFGKLIDLNKKYDLDYEISTRPAIKENKKNILILTPERFLLFLENLDVNFFDIIVMDEAYKILGERNTTISDFVNNRAYKFRKTLDIVASSNQKVIFLSPYTYEFDDSMKRFINKYNIQIINRKLEYVNHELIMLRTKNDIKNYFDIKDYFSFRAEDKIGKKVAFVLKQLWSEKNIVYVSGYDKAYDILDNYEIEYDINAKSDRFRKFFNHLINKYTTDNLEIWKVIEGLKKGIGIYISPIPRYIKKELVSLYNNNELNSFIVTTSFVEGVNTNAQNIIITSQYTAKNKLLTELDLLNIAGRAGRFGEHSIGRIIAIELDVYDRLNGLYESIVELSNPNYQYSDDIRDEYAIEMISDEYLNNEEIDYKNNIEKVQQSFGLSDDDLKKSLNVSKRWKLILYNYFKTLDKEQFINRGNVIRNLVNSETGEVANSLELIFIDIKEAFKIFGENPFHTTFNEVPPFNKMGEFIWKRLYISHSFNSMTEILKNKKLYVESIRNKIFNLYEVGGYDFSELLAAKNLSWLSSYFDKNGNVKDSYIYTETFKFISNIMQYKIPFYVNYYSSIYQLYAEKNLDSDDGIECIDSLEIAIYFENGNLSDDLQQMYDYGIPLELLKNISKNNIELGDILKSEHILDNYERIIVEDYFKLFLD